MTVIGAVHEMARNRLKSHAATKDHDTPFARGGVRNANNEVLSCHRCNVVKGDMTGPEFLEFRKTGRLAASYIAYLERSLAERGGFAINGAAHERVHDRAGGIRASASIVDAVPDPS